MATNRYIYKPRCMIPNMQHTIKLNELKHETYTQLANYVQEKGIIEPTEGSINEAGRADSVEFLALGGENVKISGNPARYSGVELYINAQRPTYLAQTGDKEFVSDTEFKKILKQERAIFRDLAAILIQ